MVIFYSYQDGSCLEVTLGIYIYQNGSFVNSFHFFYPIFNKIFLLEFAHNNFFEERRLL